MQFGDRVTYFPASVDPRPSIDGTCRPASRAALTGLLTVVFRGSSQSLGSRLRFQLPTFHYPSPLAPHLSRATPVYPLQTVRSRDFHPQLTLFTPSTTSKWLSLDKILTSYCLACAAIQISCHGIGVPADFNSFLTAAYSTAVLASEIRT